MLSHFSAVFNRPVLGEPKMPQATPATSGGTNSGIIEAPAMKPLKGVFVRTTIQEKASRISSPPTHKGAASRRGAAVVSFDSGRAAALVAVNALPPNASAARGVRLLQLLCTVAHRDLPR